MHPEKESFHALTIKDWHKWLEANYRKSSGVWLITYKKHTGKPRIEYEEAVEEALCFGWIDSKTRKMDDEKGMLWFSPRKPKSGWSRSNKERIEKLQNENRLTEYALELVEAAKKDGSWNKLDDVYNLVIPSDLEKEFSKYERARSNFENFPVSVKRGILGWIIQAKTEKTRKKRLEETARLAEDNIRAHQWKK